MTLICSTYKVTFEKDERLIKSYLRTVQTICAYCGRPLVKVKKVTLEHVIPKTDAGRTSIWNCVLACEPCNTRKGSTYIAPRFRPEGISTKSFQSFVDRYRAQRA